jgi:lactate dehydrogenase-like 2-hydroxyacid dehydrogenase
MESGKVCRVGLDVFEREPEIHPYLLQSPRASLLPVSVLFLSQAAAATYLLTLEP